MSNLLIIQLVEKRVLPDTSRDFVIEIFNDYTFESYCVGEIDSALKDLNEQELLDISRLKWIDLILCSLRDYISEDIFDAFSAVRENDSGIYIIGEYLGYSEMKEIFEKYWD